jgi:hypothetical protein
MPRVRTTSLTSFSKTFVWMATVGTEYFDSSVIACAATAGAQLLQ